MGGGGCRRLRCDPNPFRVTAIGGEAADEDRPQRLSKWSELL